MGERVTNPNPYDPADPRNHRVVARVGRPWSADASMALISLEWVYPGIRVELRRMQEEIRLSGLPCLPFCAPGWTPKAVDLCADDAQEATGSLRTGETGSGGIIPPQGRFRPSTARSEAFAEVAD